MKKVLLLCTSHNDLGLVRALRKMGYYIIATGNKADLPGQVWVDQFIQADYSDKELILSIAREEKINAICPCCNDFGVYTAAYVAEQMGLPGYDSYEVTCTLHNKHRFKEFALENDILTPRSQIFQTREAARAALGEMTFPVIIKPTDASAGNGIHKASDMQEAELAVEEAFEVSRLKTIVIEPYIEGTQHGFCTYLIDQKVVAVCTNNEYSIVNPYRVEIDTFPADEWESVSKILIPQIEKMAQILKLQDGIFHLQYILRDGIPWIIEVMRRILGNMYSIPAGLLTGIDWDYWEARARCGLSCKEIPRNTKQEGCFAYKAIMADENGKIDKIVIPDDYKKYTIDTYMQKKEGDEIGNYQKEPVGFIFMMFQNISEMKKVLIGDYRKDLVTMEKREGIKNE